MVRWLNKLFVKTSNLIIIIIIYDEQISFSTHLIKTNNCVDYSYRGDEWSLRAFASMPSTAIFLRARAEIKNLLYERASTRLNFASKSSKVKILRAVKNFNGTFITPSYRDAAEYFLQKKKLFVFLFALDCRLLPSWLTLVNDSAAVILFNSRSRKAHTQSVEKTTQTLKCVLALNYFW